MSFSGRLKNVDRFRPAEIGVKPSALTGEHAGNPRPSQRHLPVGMKGRTQCDITAYSAFTGLQGITVRIIKPPTPALEIASNRSPYQLHFTHSSKPLV
jgi:hypothetical protein